MLIESIYISKICLKLNLNRSERSVMAQFRCGVLLLRAETGSFVGEQVSDRICKMCNHGSVEDEIHFVLNCQYYTHLREHELCLVLNNEEISNKSEGDNLSILFNDYVRRTAQFFTQNFSPKTQLITVCAQGCTFIDNTRLIYRCLLMVCKLCSMFV